MRPKRDVLIDLARYAGTYGGYRPDEPRPRRWWQIALDLALFPALMGAAVGFGWYAARIYDWLMR